MRRIILACLEVHSFQPVGPGLNEPKPDIVAARRQLLPSLRLPRFIASLRDRYIDPLEARPAHQPQCQPANNNLVIRMRRKNQDPWRRSGGYLLRWSPQAAQRQRFALALHASDLRHEMLVRTMFAV